MLATLDLAHVGPFYSGQARQSLLGNPSLQPCIAAMLSKAIAMSQLPFANVLCKPAGSTSRSNNPVSGSSLRCNASRAAEDEHEIPVVTASASAARGRQSVDIEAASCGDLASPKPRRIKSYQELNLTWFKFPPASTLLAMQKRTVQRGRPSGTTTYDPTIAGAFGRAVRDARLGRGAFVAGGASRGITQALCAGNARRDHHRIIAYPPCTAMATRR